MMMEAGQCKCLWFQRFFGNRVGHSCYTSTINIVAYLTVMLATCKGVLNTLISNLDTRYTSKHPTYLLLGITKHLRMITHKLSKVLITIRKDQQFTPEAECVKACDHLVGMVHRHSFWLWNSNGIRVGAKTIAGVQWCPESNASPESSGSSPESSSSPECGGRPAAPAAIVISDNSDVAKQCKLSNEMTKLKSKIADYKQNLILAKERYCMLEIEEQLFSWLTLLSCATRETSISIIIDRRVAYIPCSEIIYLSNIEKTISIWSSLSSFGNNYQLRCHGKRSSLFLLASSAFHSTDGACMMRHTSAWHASMNGWAAEGAPLAQRHSAILEQAFIQTAADQTRWGWILLRVLTEHCFVTWEFQRKQ